MLGRTLESVKQRFGRMGLEVSWHGTGQVLLPSEVLDAFLLALAECLENVRRHSGVTQAHVTITDDETTVRAMVTDAGVGFAIADIDEAKLGFAESVVARLRDVGGNARLFSSPGRGHHGRAGGAAMTGIPEENTLGIVVGNAARAVSKTAKRLGQAGIPRPSLGSSLPRARRRHPRRPARRLRPQPVRRAVGPVSRAR